MRIEQGWSELKELHSAGKFSVFTDAPLSGSLVFLNFRYKWDSQQNAHWHGLLTKQWLIMDFPSRMLDQGSRDSLTATLEYAELTMKVNTVFVSVHKEHKDRGQLLRAFSFLGFEVVTPRNKSLPSCEEQIFMGYTLEKSP